MMKRSFVVAAVSFALISAGSLSEAAILDVTAYVTPQFISEGLPGEKIFDLTYDFIVQDISAGNQVNSIQLEFEKDVFLANPGGTVFQSDSPADWVVSFASNASIYFATLSAGTKLNKGDGLTVRFLGTAVAHSALQDASIWDEGAVWKQAFAALSQGNNEFGISGGATTTSKPIPEPYTLALFGTGLAGLFLKRRHEGAC